MPVLRWHPLLEEWVAVAADRQVRPMALAGRGGEKKCPFCPGGAEGLHSPYEFVCLENRFPTFSREPGPVTGDAGADLQRAAPGRGVCEVVLYSPRHDTTLADEPLKRIEQLVEVWRDRYEELGALPFVKYVYIFENKGVVIGVTLDHPHGQIYAFPFIPPRVRAELNAERGYLRRHRRCMICDMVKREVRGKSRLVASSRHFTAYVPFFARYPYEVHVTPRRHLGSLPEMSPAERRDMARILKTVIMKYDSLFGFSFPYIMLMHAKPTDGGAHRHHHFHIEFYPPHRSADRIKYLAGCESGAGTFINDTIPEEKAAELRAVRPAARAV